MAFASSWREALSAPSSSTMRPLHRGGLKCLDAAAHMSDAFFRTLEKKDRERQEMTDGVDRRVCSLRPRSFIFYNTNNEE